MLCLSRWVFICFQKTGQVWSWLGGNRQPWQRQSVQWAWNPHDVTISTVDPPKTLITKSILTADTWVFSFVWKSCRCSLWLLTFHKRTKHDVSSFVARQLEYQTSETIFWRQCCPPRYSQLTAGMRLPPYKSQLHAKGKYPLRPLSYLMHQVVFWYCFDGSRHTGSHWAYS